MKYIILTHGNIDELESMVETRIKEGYKPCGGVACSPKWETIDGVEDWDYHQAMIKEEIDLRCILNTKRH